MHHYVCTREDGTTFTVDAETQGEANLLAFRHEQNDPLRRRVFKIYRLPECPQSEDWTD